MPRTKQSSPAMTGLWFDMNASCRRSGTSRASAFSGRSRLLNRVRSHRTTGCRHCRALTRQSIQLQKTFCEVDGCAGQARA